MNKYYKSGEIAKMANLSIRTIRYYDNIGLLKPSMVNEKGYRLYTDKDIIKLQKILSLKNMGFSLEDIFSLTANDEDVPLKESIALQKKMIDDKIHQLKEIKDSLNRAEEVLIAGKKIDWQRLLRHINFTNMENKLVEQYKNAKNVNIRIHLHDKYSTNKVPWFCWLFSHYELKPDMTVLELGCGNGQLWQQNQIQHMPKRIILSDISDGMLQDAKEALKNNDIFEYQRIDCHDIPYEEAAFDVVIANHLLFYAHDLTKVLSEIRRVLKPGGYFYCSTYGSHHMKEITELVKEYNPKISLSNVALYDIFGLENGLSLLKPFFSQVSLKHYDDFLLVNQAEDLINYILSCHGNQAEYISKDYTGFKTFIRKKMKTEFKITKDAGLFICRK